MDAKEITPPTRDEARATLVEIERIAGRIRKSISAGCQAQMLILWGAIWIIGFLVSQFHPIAAGTTWLVLIGVGVVASFFLGRWFRSHGDDGGVYGRIGLSWLLLIAYAMLESALLTSWPFGVAGRHPYWERATAFWCCAVMFGYVMMGLWLSRFLLWLGLFVTAVAVAGLWIAPAFYGVWMAAFCGGALIASGFYIRYAWR